MLFAFEQVRGQANDHVISAEREIERKLSAVHGTNHSRFRGIGVERREVSQLNKPVS